MNHNKGALTAMGADFALGSDLIAEETEVYLNGSDRYADAYKSLPLLSSHQDTSFLLFFWRE